MEYSLIILLLPLFMFLLLGLCGHKMSHRTAGYWELPDYLS